MRVRRICNLPTGVASVAVRHDEDIVALRIAQAKCWRRPRFSSALPARAAQGAQDRRWSRSPKSCRLGMTDAGQGAGDRAAPPELRDYHPPESAEPPVHAL